MKSLVKNLYLSFGILSLLLFQSPSVYAQKHLQEVVLQEQFPTPVFWLKPIVQIEQSENTQSKVLFASNYCLLNQVVLQQNILDKFKSAPQQTIALVLVPRLDKPEGKAFLKLGNVAIFDSHSFNGYQEEKHSFERNQPILLVFRSQQTNAFGRSNHASAQFINPELFDIAEIWVCNSHLSNDQTRNLESYLALKYAVNISKNKEERYRSYFTREDQNEWYSLTEGRYNEYILGLGRIDEFEWRQTQTTTNEELPLTLALDEVLPQGQMKTLEIAKNSYLICSKTKESSQSTCPNDKLDSPFYGWKIKSSQWYSNAKYLQFTARQNGSINDSVLLTDGSKKYYLAVHQQNQVLQLTIPLYLLEDGKSYFLLSPQSNPDNFCEEKIKVVVDSTNNTIGLAISPELLPLNLEFNNLTSNTSEPYCLTESFATISTSNTGQQQLNFYNPQGKLAYSTLVELNSQVIAANEFNSYTATSLGQLKNSYLKNELIRYSEGTSLLAYPSPAAKNSNITFQLLNPLAGNYTIRVIDQNGRLLNQSERYFDNENSSWTHQFNAPGAYNIVFRINEITLSQTVIVK